MLTTTQLDRLGDLVTEAEDLGRIELSSVHGLYRRLRSREDLAIALAASGPCNLNKSPRHNWVEDHGGLPNYICHIAKSIHEKDGRPLEEAIPIAISRCKVWAAGGGSVKPDTQAKAAAAIAQWERMKASAHSKGVGKHITSGSEKVAA